MKHLKKLTTVFFMTLTGAVLLSCSNDDDSTTEKLTPSEKLASTAWETTGAVNNEGENIALTDPNVANFVGFAYFKTDGTFTMFNLDDSPKLQGDWSVSADGSTRTIIAKNDAGEELFTRVVDITVLTMEEFTYRIFPDSEDEGIYFDIIHTPTNHVEP
ncbi:DUF4822 domain-containing protein [Zhouia spongiae]|uniref:DUF4822 domain-containing protein n=1 Tax=Zhouia spongiae TaxID=2202721 RepID=A0ABY3YMS5_9FLAO|nr:DUF4822 domain-containing protein [Zhouia spongiae]UNY98920.1 DUF4822 domain-containing protein [Zhouia spongiae]